MAILKHIDFEVPGFGEFAAPPTSPALTQVPGVAPPELPGQAVLRIDTGGTPGLLVQSLGAPVSTLSTRLMLNASQVIGGTITLAVGFDAGGAPVWLLTLDAVAGAVRLDVGATRLSVDLPDAPAWHVIECGLDASAGTIALWLNGLERGSAGVSLSPTRDVWMGIALTSGSIMGPLDIAHWVFADTPIGVPTVPALADHAGDARRWLVVYNRNHADSAAWADAYRAKRGVPYANLCGLALPTNETITPEEYGLMREQVVGYLSDNNLAGQVMGVLLGFGVPGYADLGAFSVPTPIANSLHTDDTHGNAVVNPLHQDPVLTRPNASAMAGVRLTGRIDAPDLADALALLDRSDAVTAEPLAHDQGCDLVVDITAGPPGVGPAYFQEVSDWVAGGDFARLRLPAVVYDATAPLSAPDASVVWGWRDAAPSPGFFAQATGRRVLCQQYAPSAEPATSLRDPSASDWLNMALRAGFAAAAAPSRSYSLSALPLPRLLFEALRLGWTLAEAWVVAKPFLRDGLQLVGDPLMTVGFPKAGFDVFGPVDRLEQVDFNQPAAILHAGQHALQLDEADAPADRGSRYLVRRYDEHGRADAGSAAVYAALADRSVVCPALPAWPGFEGWRPRFNGGGVTMVALWPASLTRLGIDAVELVAQGGTDEPETIDRCDVIAGQTRVSFSIDRPAQDTRYRYRVVQGQTTFDTPWSAWVGPATSPTASLTLLETPA
ncbi:MAG: hypothetical protein ACE37H_10705 [Phycisphaeraceae bacterium]